MDFTLAEGSALFSYNIAKEHSVGGGAFMGK
jgi:predicted outer membrane repeat protein